MSLYVALDNKFVIIGDIERDAAPVIGAFDIVRSILSRRVGDTASTFPPL